jgi:serine/threonine-protein kinase
MKKNYSINISAEFFWKILIPGIVLTIIIAGFLGILLIDKVIIPRIVHSDRNIISVPDIRDLHWEEARELLLKKGLRLRIGLRQYSDNVKRDYVISQQPLPNEKIKKGRLIIVTISKGPEIAKIPNVRGLAERKAVIELAKQGFIIGRKKRDYSDTLEKDLVIDVYPAPGAKISREMPVDLIISDGPKPTHAYVPNLIGESLIDAKKKIEENGLTVGRIEYKINTTLAPGTVISQSVPPGSSIALKSAINIIVSYIQ